MNLKKPGLVGAVLQSPPSLIHSFIQRSFSPNIFNTLSFLSHQNQRADILRECSPPPCVTCHMSCVTCHFFFDKLVELVRGGSVINGTYHISFYYLVQLKFQRIFTEQAPSQFGLLSAMSVCIQRVLFVHPKNCINCGRQRWPQGHQSCPEGGKGVFYF